MGKETIVKMYQQHLKNEKINRQMGIVLEQLKKPN